MLTKKQFLYKKYKKYRSLFTKKQKTKNVTLIFGAQRSGTNMLADAFDKSFLIDVYHEEDETAFDDYRLKDIREIKSVIVKSWANSIVFKPICDSQNALSLLNNIKSSNAIWIFRDWNDVVNSAMKSFPNGFQELKSIISSENRGGWRGENISEENLDMVADLVNRKVSDETSRAAFWYLRNSLYYQLALDRCENVKLLKYESLVSDPVTVLHDVFTFSRVPWQKEYSEFIHQKSISKTSPPAIDKDVKKICDNLLQKMNTTLKLTFETPSLR